MFSSKTIAKGVFVKAKKRKAQIGMSSLLIYIALIIAAAIVVVVFIGIVTDSQNKLSHVADESQKRAAYMLDMLEIVGEYADDKDIDVLKMRAKIYSGATPINLKRVLITISTGDKITEAVLGQRVKSLSTSWKRLDGEYVDFSRDDETDYIRILNETHLSFRVSNESDPQDCPVALRFEDSSKDLSDASSSTPVVIDNTRTSILCGEQQVGTFSAYGTVASSTAFDEDLLLIVGHGEHPSNGEFAVDYISKGPYFAETYLNEDDIVLFMMVPHRKLTDNDFVNLRIFPGRGNTITYHVETPSVLDRTRVPLKWG